MNSVPVSSLSIFSLKFNALMIKIKCYGVIGMCVFMLYFNCKVPMQILSKLNIPKMLRCLLTSWEHRRLTEIYL